MRSAEKVLARADANAHDLAQTLARARDAVARAEAFLREIAETENRDGPTDDRRDRRDDTLAQLDSFRNIERLCNQQLAEFNRLKDSFKGIALDAAELASQ